MGQNTKSYELITFAAFLVGLPALYHSALFDFKISLISRSIYSYTTELATEFNYKPINHSSNCFT